MASGCDDTAVQLVIHANLEIPAEVDALCLQIAAEGELDFSRRYPLTAEMAGRPMTATVLPGERHDRSFEVLMTGERRGIPVSYTRRTFQFRAAEVVDEHLYIQRCDQQLNGGNGGFVWGGQLTTRPGSVAAAMPVPRAPSQLVVVWSGEGRRFMHTDQVRVLSGGLPPVPAGDLRRLLAVDVDGDCDRDLVLLAPGGPELWRHGSDGTFEHRSNDIQLGGPFDDVAAADFNLDGRVDLVLVSSAGVRLLLNNGNGTFRDGSDVLPGGGLNEARAVAVGFIDPDSYPDIVVGRGITKGLRNKILLNTYDPPKKALSFALHDASSREGKTRALGLGRLDRDGLDDLVLADEGSEPVALQNTSLAGAPKLVPGVITLASTGKIAVEDLLVVDVDADCDDDLVLARGDDVVVLTNDGGNNLSLPPGDRPTAGATTVAAVDVDGDRALDLILAGAKTGASWLRQTK